MKKVLYENLIAGKKFSDYKEEYRYIMQLIDAGKIKPVKSSPKNGKKPALYTKYWTELEEEDFSEYIDELRYKINPAINIDFYMKHLEVYKAERDYVLMLSSYFTQKKARLRTKMSENERSFDIWKKEKFLSGKSYDNISANDILRHTGISKEMLNIYRTAEPLAYYSHTKYAPQNILIIENLDPFYSMRRFMMKASICKKTQITYEEPQVFADESESGIEEQKIEICSVEFGSLIYGGGKRVTRAFLDFEEFAEPYMRDMRNKFFYVGDIDYEGIAIFENLVQNFPEGRRVFLCVEIYNAMLDAVDDDSIKYLPKMKDQRKIDIKRFCSVFENERAAKIRQILSEGRYIPQEILSF